MFTHSPMNNLKQWHIMEIMFQRHCFGFLLNVNVFEKQNPMLFYCQTIIFYLKVIKTTENEYYETTENYGTKFKLLFDAFYRHLY